MRFSVHTAQNEPDEDEDIQPEDDAAEAAPPKTAKRSSASRSSSPAETLFPVDPPPAKAKAPRASAIDEAFDIWWDQYPKKVGEKEARKAYYRIIRKHEASPEELLTGLLKYAAVKTGTNKQYIKDPAGWLNGGRWTDEHPPARMSDQEGHSDRARSSGAAPAQSWTEIALEGLRDEQLD